MAKDARRQLLYLIRGRYISAVETLSANQRTHVHNALWSVDGKYSFEAFAAATDQVAASDALCSRIRDRECRQLELFAVVRGHESPASAFS
jgi:hypothetical protein